MKSHSKTQYMVYTALCASFIAICSQVTVPSTIPFTMQTFAVMLCGMVFGSKIASAAVLIYIFSGLCGIPVFSSFRSGAGVLFGASGGYIAGLIFSALISGKAKKHRGDFFKAFLTNLLGILACYTFGTAWYSIFLSDGDGIRGILSVCVLPFVIPDILKIFLAYYCAKKIKIG